MYLSNVKNQHHKMELFLPNTCRTCVNNNANVVQIENTFINCDNKSAPILEVLNLFTQVEVRLST